MQVWFSKECTTVYLTNNSEEDVTCDWHFSHSQCDIFYWKPEPTLIRSTSCATFKLVRAELCGWHFKTTCFENGSEVTKPSATGLTKDDVHRFSCLAKLEHPERNDRRHHDYYMYEIFPADIKHVVTIRGKVSKTVQTKTISINGRYCVLPDVVTHITVSLVKIDNKS